MATCSVTVSSEQVSLAMCPQLHGIECERNFHDGERLLDASELTQQRDLQMPSAVMVRVGR